MDVDKMNRVVDLLLEAGKRIRVHKLIENIDEIEKLRNQHLKKLEAENERIKAAIVDKFMAFENDFLGRLGINDFRVTVDESVLKVFIECYAQFYYSVSCFDDSSSRCVFEAQIPLNKVNDVNTLADIKEYVIYADDGLFQNYSAKDANELLEKYKDTPSQEITFTRRGGRLLMKGTYYPEGGIIFPDDDCMVRDKCIKVEDVDIKRVFRTFTYAEAAWIQSRLTN